MTKADFLAWYTGCDVSGRLNAVNSLSSMHLLHSQEILYMPGDLGPRLSLMAQTSPEI
jgi:hypothetical protein